MTQDVTFGASNSESASASESAIALSVSIADPFVLLRMSDGSVRLLIGGKFLVSYFHSNKLYIFLSSTFIVLISFVLFVYYLLAYLCCLVSLFLDLQSWIE